MRDVSRVLALGTICLLRLRVYTVFWDLLTMLSLGMMRFFLQLSILLPNMTYSCSRLAPQQLYWLTTYVGMESRP